MEKIPTVVISLSPERLKPLMSQLEGCPALLVHIQKGFIGKKVIDNSKLIDRTAFKFLNGREMTSGEAGCALAHFSVYQKIFEHEWKWTLVLEDNARLLPGAQREILMLLEALQSSDSFNRLPILIHLNLNEARIVARRIRICNSFEIYEPLTILRTTKAYLINDLAAKIALKDGLPLKDVADWPHWIHGVKFLASIKDSVYVDRSFPSEIELRLTPRAVVQKLHRRILSAMLFISGIEALRYRRNTGLLDYFLWVIMDRIHRVAAIFFGRQDQDNTNVILVENSILRHLKSVALHHYRAAIKRRHLGKGPIQEMLSQTDITNLVGK